MKTGIQLIDEERIRQITEKGFDENHDSDEFHSDGQMAKAAAVYALGSCLKGADRESMEEFGSSGSPYFVKRIWPWDWKWFKPTSEIRDLVKAGALIAAEIDRRQRVNK